MNSQKMIKKNCPICETNKFSKIIYNSNIENNINKIDYSGRKKPDGLHYEMVRCGKCTDGYPVSSPKPCKHLLFRKVNLNINLNLMA